MAYALNPRFWLVVLVLFGLALLKRWWTQWRRERARRQGVKRP